MNMRKQKNKRIENKVWQARQIELPVKIEIGAPMLNW